MGPTQAESNRMREIDTRQHDLPALDDVLQPADVVEGRVEVAVQQPGDQRILTHQQTQEGVDLRLVGAVTPE